MDTPPTDLPFFSSLRTGIAFKENITQEGKAVNYGPRPSLSYGHIVIIREHLNRHSEEEKRRIITAQSLG